MSTKTDYETKIEVITAITVDQIKTPAGIPVEVYIQEAEDLFKGCLNDEAELVGKGVPWDFVLDLPIRSGALREAETDWGTARRTKEEAEKQWEEKAPTAYTFRNELQGDLRFAFRKDTGLTSRMKDISSGSGYPDMIQDLNDLQKLGRQNPGLLEPIGFDMTKLDRAQAMVDELSELYADVKQERVKAKAAKKIRDQAYTHLKEAVDEIRDYGRYAFRWDDDRKKVYRSEHISKMNRKAGKSDSPSTGDGSVSETPETPAE